MRRSNSAANMCLLPVESRRTDCSIKTDSHGKVCVHMAKGSREITLKVTDADLARLDKLALPQVRFVGDDQVLKVTGDGGMHRRNAVALAILRGAIGLQICAQPQWLSTEQPFADATPTATESTATESLLKAASNGLKRKVSELKGQLEQQSQDFAKQSKDFEMQSKKIGMMRLAQDARPVTPNMRLLMKIRSPRARFILQQAGARKRRMLTPWPKLSESYKKTLIKEKIVPLMQQIKEVVRDLDGMEEVFAEFLSGYCVTKKKQGVRASRCFFRSAISLFEKAGLMKSLRVEARKHMKESVSAYELMLLFDDIGISQFGQRKLRKKYVKIFHGEKIVLREKQMEYAQVEQKLGKCQAMFIEIKGAVKRKHPRFAHKYLGYKWHTGKFLALLAARAATTQMQPEDAMVDFDQAEEEAKDRLRAELDKVLKDDKASDVYKIKKEAELQNVESRIDNERRRCKLGKVNFTAAKERCIGTLIHRQLLQGRRQLIIWVKGGFDGRQILRQLNSSKESDQFCASWNLVNDGAQVQSVNSTFGSAYSPGGESNCWPLMKEIMQELAELRDDGYTLPDPVRVHQDGVCYNVHEVQLAFRVTLTIDGACMFKLCLGPCGGSARFPCPCCHHIHDNNSKEWTCHFAYVMVEVSKGETPNQFAQRNNMSTLAVREGNDLDDQLNLQAYTTKRFTLDLEDDRYKGQELECDVSAPWDGLHEFKDDEPMQWRGRGKRFLRGRHRQKMDRPLRQEVADYGWTWEDFCMCVTHEPMRQIEWKVYHIMRTSDLSMKEINEWLDGRVNFQGESTENNVAKPSFNYVKAATVWLEEDPLQSGIDLWESFVDFADGGREDTKDVWHAYINMRSIQQEPYPTDEQIDEFDCHSFDYFLAWVTRYEKAEHPHYLHLDGHHAGPWMRHHRSLALNKNGNSECLNSVDKQHQQNNCTHGGLGGNMCLDAAEHNGRRLIRYCCPKCEQEVVGGKVIDVTHNQWSSNWCQGA